MKRILIILVSIFPLLSFAQTVGQESVENESDTIISDSLAVNVKNLQLSSYDDLNGSQKPIDLKDPENITTETIYDPVTGNYVIHTKIGDIDISTPYLMTEKEYKDYSEKRAISAYWQQKQSEQEHDNEKKFDITDMKFNIGPADKVFGPGGVQLKLQGSAELMFGFKHQFINNPSLSRRAQNNNIFDFDEKIQASVNGKVGDKLNFNLNYNTEASFSFDKQNLKLDYKGQEDDIIQTLEAGNVSMSLNSQLITGSQALFGIKANLKFGKFTIQALLSQQNSESQSVSSQGGAQTTSFEVTGDSYDENRHFFLSHFFRDNYEASMAQLPYVTSGVTVNKIEVWITNKRGMYDNARNIVAFADLGEADDNHIQGYGIHSQSATTNPYNRANNLYADLNGYEGIRDIQQTNATLQQYFPQLIGGEDYEKLESARLLSSSEYTLNASLGYISLRTSLNQDEVLCVAYEYTYGGQVYQVGEFSTDGSEALKSPNTLILKMLKSSNNSPDKKGRGVWDLMMKNVYSIGASQMSSDKFELYVMFRNDSIGTNVQYLPEGDIKGKQLLRVMNLDRLDQKNNPYADGKFDYVEGYTAISSNGRIIFPVLEPFGSYLRRVIGNDAIADKYVFQELYDSTLVVAQEMSEKNKFTLIGKYKGSSGSEIRLNAMNVPRGSVKVTAGGATLVENIDYTVDYTMGVVTILNQSILDSGTNVDVKLENQSLFSMQRKTLVGTHMEYAFSKDLVVGGTLMHMTERPLTTKVNTGSEPLSNTIWGVNLSWKREFMWLTNLLDKLPWTTATAPSSIQLNGEFAHLIPGHTRDVGKIGLSYIDDFEATKTNIDIHHPAFWRLSSTPSLFAEATMSNDLEYGKNRAHLAWYNVDPLFGNSRSSLTPQYIRDDLAALSDHRTRIVLEQEIYPNREQLSNEESRRTVLNLAYYPEERGQYNIVADEIDINGRLTNPAQRWGGIMRRIDNTDFEKANIEYIEFWLMDPFLTNPDPSYQGGDLYINLGDVSEDILHDGKKSFEHGMPVSPSDAVVLDTTVWGRVPRTTSTVTAFSNEAGARDYQDIGLNGLSTDQEFEFEYNGKRPYADYVAALQQKVSPSVLAQWRDDPYSPLNDPAGDNYHYYLGNDWDEQQVSILDRYKHYNGTEGNSPAAAETGQAYSTAATLQPDIEDINSDNTLSEYEKYYQYRIQLRPSMMQVGMQHITERMVASVRLDNGETADVVWYQFKIPIRSYDTRVGSIRNFKSIRFIRLFLTNFTQETYLRFASLDLVRGEWRGYTKDLYPVNYPPTTQASLDVQAINIEENSSRSPVNYVLPPGVVRQTDPGQAQIIPQNEQAMVLRVHDLAPRDARAVYKNTSYDMRQYKNLQMFVHAEALAEDPELQDGDLSCFIRLGSDMTNNYYEYEIPLFLTPAGIYNGDSDREKVWKPENMFDFPFSVLTDAKIARNKAKRAGNPNISNLIPYTIYDEASGKPKNRITVMGNPTIEDVENIMIGIRNNGPRSCSGEVWVNELRMSDYNEKGGVAAMGNVALALSDIGQVNFAGRIETAGYGSIESNVMSRNLDNRYQMSVSAAFEAGRLFPEKAQIQLPLYVSYSNETLSPEYDPLDTDIKLSETLDTYETKQEKDSIRAMSNTIQTSTNFTISTAKVNIHSKKRNMFYDPANFSLSYALSIQNQHTPEIEKNYSKTHRGSFNYSYNFNPKPWEPFKNVKNVDKLKWIKELNIYYLPQSWAFSTDMNRQFTHMKMRDFNTDPAASQNMDLTFSKDFAWNRKFDFKYDLTKNIKFTFATAMNAIIDEGYYTPEIIKDYAFTNDYYEAWKDTIKRSLAHWGRPYTYNQVFTMSASIPFNRISWLDWITANGSYNATYNWDRMATAASDKTDLGNRVASLNNWQVDGQFNFENLYSKSKYWKDLKNRYGGRVSSRRQFKPKTFTDTRELLADSTITINHRLSSDLVTVTITDAEGKKVSAKVKTIDKQNVQITSKSYCQAATITISTRNPNERTPLQITGDMAAYFGTMIRRVQVTYRQTDGITLPGFGPEAGFMGQRKTNGIFAPGFDFAFGFFPNNFVEKAKANGWLSPDTTVVQPATRAKTSDLDIKLTLEPFPGFKIQVNGKRYQAESTSIIYSYDRLQENTTGSFNITQVALATAFDRIGNADNNFATNSFARFLEYRDILAGRVQAQYDGLVYPDAGFIKEYTLLGNHQYSRANGTVNRNSADVLVPAFFAAYTKRDPNRVSLNPFLGILNILPNWSVTFDGLGKLPWIRDHFRSVNITHAYVCKYSISSFASYSTWVPAEGNSNKMLGFVRDVTTDAPIPSSAYDISNITISEQFSPLIGVNIAMKNSMTAKVEYRKQRNLALNITSVQMTEGSTNELVIGFGYTIKDFDIILGLKEKQTKVKNDLKLNVDISYKDVKTLLRKVEEGITQASSGNKVFGIKVAVDYVLSQKVNLQFFYDHQGTTPIISTSYPIKSDNAGINIKLMLTR